jgi:hypothetical protein
MDFDIIDSILEHQAANAEDPSARNKRRVVVAGGRMKIDGISSH